MTTTSQMFKTILRTLMFFVITANAHGALTDLSNAPLVVSTTSSLPVKPNIFLMMDDSGSMAWGHMPDDAADAGSTMPMTYGYYGFRSSQCNGVYYDPAITYTPPVDSTGTSYPNSSFTGAWTDGYNTGAGTVNLSTNFKATDSGSISGQDTTGVTGYYYQYIGSQTTEILKNYYDSTSTFFKECSSVNNASPGNSKFYRVNLSSTAATSTTAIITVGGTGGGAGSNTSVSSIKVNGVELLNATTATVNSISSSTMAANIAAKITLNGFTATASGSVITITGPVSAATYIPVLTVTNQGSMTFTPTIFPKTDTTAAQLTNFANWYSYYRTRILMMKTASGIAFKPVTSSFRVGFATMNNNGGADFLNPDSFDSTQRSAFYTMLYGTSAGSSTPLLKALSDVGLMYAHKLPGNTLNGVTVQDPIQYSCQQNFAILSTDGFWNDATNSKLTGGSVGNQDGTEIRPMYDGASQTSQVSTPTTTVVEKRSVQNTTITTPWTRTVTTVGAACSTPAVIPSNKISAYMSDNSHSMAVGLSATDPDPSNPGRCYQLGGSGAGTAWFCRGAKNSGTAAVSSSSATDSTGKTWYLVSSVTGNTNCVTNSTAWGGGYSSSKGACPSTPAVSGNQVTIQNQTYNQLVVGATMSVDDYTTVDTATVKTINGQSQPATHVITGPTITNISTTPAVTSDTGAPGGGTTWTTTTTTGPTCTANPPAAGTTAPAQGTTTTTNNGSPTVTTLSTVTTIGATSAPIISASGGTSNTLADVAEYYYVTDLRTATLGNCTGVKIPLVTGTANTLCTTPDPAAQTPPALDPYNNVPSSGLDAASWQHMTTFTLGLGARGRMVFSPTYLKDTSGDFFSVSNGVLASNATTCSWQNSNGKACNWPTPNSSGVPENIDDLWHAAVNGRGTYFSATNPDTLATAISAALAGVTARTGASAAATTSNPNVTSGDNFVFSSTFVTQDWYGELVRQQLDLTNGKTLTTIDPATGKVIDLIDWSAQGQLDTNASRTIYTFSSGATNHLQDFSTANFGADTNFSAAHISTLSQLCATGATCITPLNWQASHAYSVNDRYKNGATWYQVNTAYTSGATFDLASVDTTNSSVLTPPSGINLVNFIRGDTTNEEGLVPDTRKYYRHRTHILGDIVNAEAVYVKSSQQNYVDSNYTTFAGDNTTRQGMVYAAANDGMLHAFYANTGMMNTVTGKVATSSGANVINVAGGAEAWAYIPSLVLPNLYKLADKNYPSNHQYYVDGTPIQGEVCISNCATLAAVWKTILVGGLNGGGRGYYALDVTNPAAPKALWEFTDTNMGYTYGNPEIAKLSDGTWVVLVTSGYNNVSPGDGQGHLYVLDAYSGTLIRDIPTGVGNTTTPSGLSRIIAQVADTSTNAKILQVYGGDLFGNLWRFDVNNNVGAAGYDAQLLVHLTGSTGLDQPITTKPQVGVILSNTVVYVGTGRYLGITDLSNTSPQSIYAIMDPLTPNTTPGTAIYSSVRAGGSGFIQQTQTTTVCPPGSSATICTAGQIVRTSSHNAVTFPTNKGWYIDLPDTGERATTDPTLKLATLGFTTIVPSVSACTVGGISYSYFFDYKTGAPVSTSLTGVVAVKLGNALATRPVYVRLPNNVIVQLIRLSDGTTMTTNVPIGGGAAGTRRVNWRELIKE